MVVKNSIKTIYQFKGYLKLFLYHFYFMMSQNIIYIRKVNTGKIYLKKKKKNLI